MKIEPNRISWPRVIARGALWALVYNLIWSVAWFALMRKEWQDAATAIGKPMPWTVEVWIVWGIFTFPIGGAIMAYAASHTRSALKRSHLACVATWALLTIGMAVSCIQASFSMRVIAMDSGVNLIAMLAASAAGARNIRSEK